MNRFIRTGVISLAGLVGVGIASVGAGAATPASIDTKDMFLNKRELSSVVLAAADDDDDKGDNTNSRSRSRDNSYSRSRATNDNTNSRYTKQSRDRDRSRGDLTKDFTKDGPGPSTRDWSRNYTNDRSRNDTR